MLADRMDREMSPLPEWVWMNAEGCSFELRDDMVQRAFSDSSEDDYSLGGIFFRAGRQVDLPHPVHLSASHTGWR